MTSVELKRIATLSAELAVAIRALAAIETGTDLGLARSQAGAALKIIRSSDVKDWENNFSMERWLEETGQTPKNDSDELPLF